MWRLRSMNWLFRCPRQFVYPLDSRHWKSLLMFYYFARLTTYCICWQGVYPQTQLLINFDPSFPCEVGVRRYHPQKILNTDIQFRAFWCVLAQFIDQRHLRFCCNSLTVWNSFKAKGWYLSLNCTCHTHEGLCSIWTFLNTLCGVLGLKANACRLSIILY